MRQSNKPNVDCRNKQFTKLQLLSIHSIRINTVFLSCREGRKTYFIIAGKAGRMFFKKPGMQVIL